MRVSMKLYSKIMRVAVFFGFVVACCCAGSNGVFADSYVGPGGGTGGQQTDCEYLGGYQKLCDGGANGGGASWHLYKTSEIKCEGGSNCRIPGLTSNEVKSKNGTYIYDGSVKIDDIYSNCVVDRGGSMFVAYGWEGNNSYKNTNWDGNKGKFIDKVDGTTRDGSGNGLDWLLGPAAYGIGTIGGAQYNNYENKTISEGDLRNGNINESNIRLSLDSAQMIYQSVTGDTGGIPAGTGYFCAGSPRYFAVSNVSNGNGWTDTDLAYNGGGVKKNKETLERTIKRGETITLTFSHELYSVFYESNSVEWNTVPSGRGWGESGTSYVNAGGADKKINFTFGPITAHNKTVYRPERWPVYNGSDGYIARQEYSVTFDKDGKYEFCDGLKLGNEQLTTVCTIVNVEGQGGDSGGDPEVPNVCLNASRWKPTSWKNGQGEVGDGNKNYKIYTVSGVLNSSLDYGLLDTKNIDNWAINNDGVGSWGKDNMEGSGSVLSPRDTNSVYAKPNDVIYWNHCYFSEVKAGNSDYDGSNKEKSLGAELGVIASDDTCPDSGSMKNKIAGFIDGFEVKSKPFDYYVKVNNDNTLLVNSNNAIWRSSSSTIPSADYATAGSSWTQSMSSLGFQSVRIYDDKQKCGCTKNGQGNYVNCGDNSPITEYKANEDVTTSTAMVKIPYNFTISNVGLNLINEETVVYAGERVKINTSLTVSSRQNNTTQGNYATAVKNASVAVIAYTVSEGNKDNVVSKYEALPSDGYGKLIDNGNLCGAFDVKVGGESVINCDYDDKTKTLNELGDGSKVETGVFDDYINVMDDDAGKYFCAALAVFPATTYGDTDVNDEDGNPPWENTPGNYKWKVSSPDCRKIAKKPSMQIWGGSLYTNNKIVLKTANKGVLAGFDYELKSRNSGTTTFGSWVESGIMANGMIDGLASGAATGYYNPNNRERNPHDGVGGSYSSGSDSDGVCVLGPLTMPNKDCVISKYFSPGGYGAESFGHDDRESLVSVFDDSSSGNFKKVVIDSKYKTLLSFLLKTFGDEVEIETGREGETGVWKILKSTEGKMQTWILDASAYGNFGIDMNIVYEDGGYTALWEIPKVIIYAGNIKISCDVTRIDAVLITAEGGNINTCSDADRKDANDVRRSKQLKINGTIITDKLIAGRTYGAGTGSASAVPAEIIDYDTSLYLWAMQNAKGSNSGKMDVVYLTELAPRY